MTILTSSLSLMATPVGAPGAPVFTALSLVEKNQASDLAKLKKDPVVAREIERFKTALAKAKSPEDLLRNASAREFLLTGMGLGDEADSTGIALKALTQDPTAKGSLVSRLPDKRWKTVAETLRFDRDGLKTLKLPDVMKRIEDEFVRNAWYQKLDEQTPGMADALKFKERAKNVKSLMQVLGDGVLRRVATTAAGLPPELAVQSVDAQERSLSARLKVTDFSNPKKADLLARRYLAARADEGPVATQPTNPALAILGASGTAVRPGSGGGMGSLVLDLFA